MPLDIAALTVNQLREHLTQAGLDPKGSRNAPALRKRLAKALGLPAGPPLPHRAPTHRTMPARAAKVARKPSKAPAANCYLRIVRVAEHAAPSDAPAKPERKSKHTPESIGIGKILRHNMRDGSEATCKVTAKGFVVNDGTRYSSLGAAAAHYGQLANGLTFWRLAPYPKHAPKARG